jgi:hypothetical protein
VTARERQLLAAEAELRRRQAEGEITQCDATTLRVELARELLEARRERDRT